MKIKGLFYIGFENLHIIKCLCFVLMFVSVTVLCHAQRESNHIYLFDCTQSMQGKFGGKDIWKQTLSYLESEIKDIKCPGTTVNIVPFNNTAKSPLAFERSEFNWQRVLQELEKYVKDGGAVGTNICDAWDAGVGLIDAKKDNYFILLTDGVANTGGSIEELCRKIRNFCQSHNNTYGFYVMLTNNAFDQKIRDAIKETPCVWEVPINGTIKEFGAFEKNNISINILELPKQIELVFTKKGDYSVSIISDNPYFIVKAPSGKMIDGRVEVEISSNYSVGVLSNMLSLNYSFTFEVTSTEIDITNQEIMVNVKTEGERTLTVNGKDEIDIGESQYYKKFLFWKERKIDTLEVDLNPIFNDLAVRYNSSFSIGVNSDDDNVHFFINGNKVKDLFTMRPNQDAKVSVVIVPGAKEGKHYIQLSYRDAQCLERVNDNDASEYELSLRAKYCVKHNPLAIILFWLVVAIVVFLIFWFCAIRPSLYPKIRGGISYTITMPYFSPRNIGGVYKVVFASTRKKQSLFSRIFKGKEIYEVNPIWTSTIELTANRNGLRINTFGRYIITPYSNVLLRQTEYELQNMETNNKITIRIN